jgi:hypothetical protein
MSKPARVVVALVAVWTTAGSILVLLDLYRPTGDWRGSLVSACFVVLYGLVAAGVVWAIDKTAKRLRTTSTV